MVAVVMETDLNVKLSRPYTSHTFRSKLKQFEHLIAELTQQDSEASAEQRRQAISENLRFDTFCEAIRALFGQDIRSTDLKAIFRKITTNPDANVDWSEIFGYFQAKNEDQDQLCNEDISVFSVANKFRIGEAAGDKKRRDVIFALVSSPEVDIYAAASQKGALSVWNSKTLRLMSCCELNETTWITGVDYLPTLRRLAITSERSLWIWDYRAKDTSQNIFCIKPFESSIHCMTQVPYSKSLHEECILIGDDQGYINLITIAAKDLNTKHAMVDKKSGSLVLEPNTLTHPIYRRKVHEDWVLKVTYLPDLECFASCSVSPTSSFVLESVNRLKDNQIIRTVDVPRGVNAFAFSSRANIIATGGNDKIVRVWHPHIFTRPTGRLMGHLFTVIDVAINEKDQHIISLSTARIFRVWDIHTLTSLQVFADNEDRPGEKRIQHIIYDEKHERLIAASSVLDAWPLTRTVQDTMQVPQTHDRPICETLYNAELNQMVTVCTESVIKVWEMETSKLVYTIKNPHGANVEVTALAIDDTGYRLASGAVNGTIKIWDFGSGQEIGCWNESHSARDIDLSITSMVFCQIGDKRCIAVVGWKDKFRLLKDSPEQRELTLLMQFSDVTAPIVTPSNVSSRSSASIFNKTPPLPDIKPSNPKEHLLEGCDLSCVVFLPPKTLITGCNSGNIILWNTSSNCLQNVFCIEKSHVSFEKKHGAKAAYPKKVQALTVILHKTDTVQNEHLEDDKVIVGKPAESTDDTPPQTSGSEADMEPGTGQPTNKVAEEGVEALDGTAPAAMDDDVHEHTDLMDEAAADLYDMGDEQDGGVGEVRTPADRGGTLPAQTSEHRTIIVSCHEDAIIRFWSEKGELLREVSAMIVRQGTPVTAVCHDEDCNTLITADQKGFITMWDVSDFLGNLDSDQEGTIEQIICWRAHLSKIVSLVYVARMKAMVSGSIDGSVRVWYGGEIHCAHFMGFFNQHRPWNYPSIERSCSPVLPYDITERPLRQKKNVGDRRPKPSKYEYPLMFADTKWKPFRRSAYFARPSAEITLTDKKFFSALEKPHFYNDHLQSCKTGDMRLGAVFRALPVYRVGTPDRIKTPVMNTSLPSNSYLFAPPPKTARSVSPIGEVDKANQQEAHQKKRLGHMNASVP